jgi:hypothetical protein
VDVYAGLGDLASKSVLRRDNGAKQVATWKEARAWYRKSLDIWQQLPFRTPMAPNRFDIAAPETVAQHLATCNQAIQRLQETDQVSATSSPHL